MEKIKIKLFVIVSHNIYKVFKFKVEILPVCIANSTMRNNA